MKFTLKKLERLQKSPLPLSGNFGFGDFLGSLMK
jgi:hypothetical protein